MRYAFLFLVFLVWAIGVLDAAEGLYPRPWENITWVHENPYAMSHVFGVRFEAYGSELSDSDREFLENALAREIPDFQQRLEGMGLEALEMELARGLNVDEDLSEAVVWKRHAAEIAVGIEDFVPGKWSWDLWHFPGNWQNCVDYSLLSLEGQGLEINQKRADFNEVRGKLAYGGACDGDYTGPAMEFCEMPLEDVYCDYSGIWEHAPDLSWYPECMRRHWNVSAELGKKLAAIQLGYNESLDACTDGKSLAKSKQDDAKALMKKIDAEKIEKIYKSSYGKESSRAMGIKGQYASLVEAMEVADEAYDTAFYAKDADRGWIKECISGSGIAASGYAFVAKSKILEETTSVVTEYGENAWAILENAKGLRGRMGELGAARLAVAENACKGGDNGKLGDRFEDYGKCILYANMATESVTKGEGVIEAYMEAELAWVEGFLENARKDGIDTHNEEVQVAVLKETKFGDHKKIVKNIEESIIARAGQMYAGLPARRDSLKAEIAKGGSGFKSLETWFVGEECYTGKSLNYYCAIGQLRNMSKSYDELEEELENRKSELVWNSISIDAHEKIGVAWLDGKSDAYLYVIVANPSKFNGENIVFSVNTEYGYRKMDMVQGEERARIVTPSKSSIEIHVSEIKAGETVNLAFMKEEIVCRTTSRAESAYGDNKGGAIVAETYKIDCAQAVDGLVFENKAGVKTVVVNGVAAPVSGSTIMRELGKGKHTLEMEYYDYDAYLVEREVGFVSSMAQKTTVELFLNFHPKRDLAHLSFSSVEEGKALDKLKVFGYTGEKISDTNVGGSTIFFKVLGLKEGKEAKVRISYEINDLRDYVVEEIAKYSSQNLTSQELSLLNAARNDALDDKNADAYKKLEQLRSAIDSREKTRAKVLEKHEKIKERLVEKETALGNAIALAEALGVENSFVNEMRARLGEIRAALAAEVPEGVLIGPLEGFDMGWEGKELTKISKALLADEKSLKKEWSDAGADGPEMQKAIKEIEEKNSRFAGTASFSDAMEAFGALGAGGEALALLLGEKTAADAEGGAALKEAVAEAYSAWDAYNREYSEAEKSSWKGVFPMSANDASRELKKLEGRKDYEKAIEETGALKGRMEGTIRLLEGEAARLGENVELLYMEMGAGMEEKDASFVGASIEMAKGYSAEGQYMLAIKSLEEALKKMQKAEKKQDGIIVLAITGLLVLGAVALYLMREKIPADLLKQKKGREKEYKKLKREL